MLIGVGTVLARVGAVIALAVTVASTLDGTAPVTGSRTPSAAPPTSSRSSRRWAISPRAYTLLWDGHSILGVVAGLALFVMFFCGALGLYRGELHQWVDPALRTRTTDVASISSPW